MALSNPGKLDSKLADSQDNPQIAESQAVVAELTDSSGGTADGTVAAVSGSGADTDINNNFAEVTTKVNAILQILAAHGLMDDA
jgi:hypothetical protein